MKKAELACAPSNSNVIYAVAQGGSGSTDVEWFKKSTNGGSTWSVLPIPLMVDASGSHFTRGQSFYDLILAVHPTNQNLVIAGGIDLHRTTNGGTGWTGISHWYGGFGKPEVHADQHAIHFDLVQVMKLFLVMTGEYIILSTQVIQLLLLDFPVKISDIT